MSDDAKAEREKVALAEDGLIQRLRDKMCARDNEAVQKVTGGGGHQNANVVRDIYCRVLMQFKTGSLS